MEDVAEQQGDRDREEARDLARAERGLAEHFQHVREDRDPRAEQNEPDDVERIAVLGTEIREMPVHHVQAKEPDGQVHEEDRSPVQKADDQATGERPKHRTDQTGDRDEAHGSNEFGFRERAHDSQPPDGHHHCAATALKDAAGNEQMNVGADAAEERAEGEEADGRAEYAPRAKAICHPAADGNENGEADGVAREHGLHAQRRDVQCRGNGRHGGVEDRGVERLHEKRDGHEPRDHALGRVGDLELVAHAVSYKSRCLPEKGVPPCDPSP